MTTAEDRILERVREHAFRSLKPRRTSTTNLSIDSAVREEGEPLGPEFQRLRVRRPSIVVFADEEPLANFGHQCHYLLYDPETAELYTSLPARFPPWNGPLPQTLQPFHTPVQAVRADALFNVWPPFHCPRFIPDGNRYAIVYSGMSNTRHLNDMEFGYRTLIHQYGFDPANITVLSYDGTTDTQDGSNSVWPGDGTAYQIQIDGKGDQAAFEAAIDALKAKLGAEDLLFIHTNNHGDWNGSESFLCEYPSWASYLASDFCSKLAELPGYRSLIVMMEQCNSGGFITPILGASTAGATSVACAATAGVSSWATTDGNWDSFAYEWFAAQAGAYPSGAALASNPDANGDGKIEATEAYAYASAEDNQDTPQYGDSGASGGEIALGQEYTIWWWWCWLLREILEARYLELPQAEYYEQLRTVEPQLRGLVRSIDARSDDLRNEVTTRLREIFGM
jgi:Peptidase C13 family